ncbi:MAG: hypothetical protein H0W48_05910, partial [Methylibium sp.]|nr:hypothetical protein [Methylibium sp.]
MAGYERGETSGQSALNLPVWPFRVVFVIAFAMLALQVLCELMKSLRGEVDGDRNDDNPARAS